MSISQSKPMHGFKCKVWQSFRPSIALWITFFHILRCSAQTNFVDVNIGRISLITTNGLSLGVTDTDLTGRSTNTLQPVALTWTPWREASSNMLTDRTVSCMQYQNNIYVFAKRINDNRIFYVTFDGTKWGDWREVAGGGVTDSALAATEFNNKLYLFSKGITDKVLYQNMFDGAKWDGWAAVPVATTDSAPDATSYGGYLYLFRKGLGETNVYFNAMNLTGWTGWVRTPTNVVTDTSIGATSYGQTLLVFWKSQSDDKIYMFIRNGTSWISSTEVAGGLITDVALSASAYDKQTVLFAKDIRNRGIWVDSFNGTTWSGGSLKADGPMTKLTPSSCVFKDSIYMFMVATNTRVYYTSVDLGHKPVGHVNEITNMFKIEKGSTLALPTDLKPSPPDQEEAELFDRVTNHPVEHSFTLTAGAEREFSIQILEKQALAVSVDSYGGDTPLTLTISNGNTNLAQGTAHPLDSNHANVVALAKLDQPGLITVRIFNGSTNTLKANPSIDSIK